MQVFSRHLRTTNKGAFMNHKQAPTAAGRSKICSSIDRDLIAELEDWSHENRVSRSAAIETAIGKFLHAGTEAA